MSKLPRLLPLIAVAVCGVVAMRAVSSAPELSALFNSTARAETAGAGTPGVAAAGQAGAARAAARPQPTGPMCAPTAAELARQAGLSPAELRVLQTLGERRGQLDARERTLSTQVALLEAASRKLEDRTRALAAVRGELQGLLGQADAQTQTEVNRLVAVYSNMRPREAAAIFTTLNDSVRLPVAAAMRPQKLAAIMAAMPPQAARELTERLARRFAGAQAVAGQARAAMAAPAASAPTMPAPSAAAPAASAPASTTATAPAVTPPAAAATPPAAAARRPAPRPRPRPARPAPQPAQAAPARTPAPQVADATPPPARPAAAPAPTSVPTQAAVAPARGSAAPTSGPAQ